VSDLDGPRGWPYATGMSKEYGFLYTRPWFTHPTRFQAWAFAGVQSLLFVMAVLRGTECFSQAPTFMTWVMVAINIGSIVHIVRRYRATRAAAH
jgi:hypothetical protein